MKELVLYFPPGIICSNRLFNDAKQGSFMLKTHLGIIASKVQISGTQEIPFIKPYIYWKLVIEETTKHSLFAHKKIDTMEELVEALGAFGIHGV